MVCYILYVMRFRFKIPVYVYRLYYGKKVEVPDLDTYTIMESRMSDIQVFLSGIFRHGITLRILLFLYSLPSLSSLFPLCLLRLYYTKYTKSGSHFNASFLVLGPLVFVKSSLSSRNRHRELVIFSK